MKPTFWQKLDLWARNLTPIALTLFLALLSATPSRLPGFSGVAPMLALMSVYYWSIARPDLMRPIVAFALGFFVDLLGGGVMGLNALVFTLTQGIVSSQQRYFLARPFYVGWWAFGLVGAAAASMQWLIMAVMYSVLLAPEKVMVSYLLTLALYPIFGWGFARIHLSVVREA